jgi:hypothetical protein
MTLQFKQTCVKQNPDPVTFIRMDRCFTRQHSYEQHFLLAMKQFQLQQNSAISFHFYKKFCEVLATYIPPEKINCNNNDDDDDYNNNI